MADIWTNKKGTAATNWDLEDQPSSQTWSSGPDESYGTTSNAAGTVATYDSAAQAATSLIGTRYHLFDNKEFFFGTSKNYRMSYETDGSGFLIRTNPAIASNYLFTIRNGMEDIFTIDTVGTLVLSDTQTLPTIAKEGSISYVDNEFYVYK